MKPSGKPLISMRTALGDPRIFGDIPKDKSVDFWRSVLIAARGEDLTKSEMKIFKKFRKNRAAPAAGRARWSSRYEFLTMLHLESESRTDSCWKD